MKRNYVWETAAKMAFARKENVIAQTDLLVRTVLSKLVLEIVLITEIVKMDNAFAEQVTQVQFATRKLY